MISNIRDIICKKLLEKYHGFNYCNSDKIAFVLIALVVGDTTTMEVCIRIIKTIWTWSKIA